MRPATRVTVVGLLVLAIMVGLFAVRPVFLDRLELSLLDWRFRVRGAEPPGSTVAIVTIDAKSIDQLGRWPWRRSVIADLLDKLREAKTAAIGLDIVFSEPEVTPETEALQNLRASLAKNPEDAHAVHLVDETLTQTNTDGLLEAAMARNDNLVLGFFFRTELDAIPGGVGNPEALKKELRRVKKGRVKIVKDPAIATGRDIPILTCTGVEPNLDRFGNVVRRMGFFTARPDPDGVVRRASLLASCGEKLFVSLDLAIVETLMRTNAMAVADENEQRQVRLGSSFIPTDEGYSILINYRGPARSFPHYSIADVLSGAVGEKELAGRVILVGPTETGIGDVHAVPFQSAFPGVEVHANILDNLITGNVLSRNDGLVLAELAAIVFIGLFLTLVIPRMGGAGRGALVASLLLALVTSIAVYAFIEHGQWVNLAYPAVSLVAIYLAVQVTHSVTVEAKSRMVRRQFATYVSPQVVAEMLDKPGSFRLGGERRNLSVLFSDIQGFTTTAEELGPEVSVQFLNEYLTPMTEIVLNSRGTLDKYIGDAVVAFWGAPLPEENHPLRACEAAIEMQRQIDILRRDKADLPGVSKLFVRIGIHSGDVVVGNMGSAQHFDYTITGDGVNLCARLEGLNKFYGTKIMGSEDIVKRLPEGFLTRELDEIRVKGKKGSVRVFEIIGRRSPEGDEKEFLEAYAAGLDGYRHGRWEEALRAFDQANSIRNGSDGSCDTMIERIETLKEKPPADWQGVWTFQEK